MNLKMEPKNWKNIDTKNPNNIKKKSLETEETTYKKVKLTPQPKEQSHLSFFAKN